MNMYLHIYNCFERKKKYIEKNKIYDTIMLTITFWAKGNYKGGFFMNQLKKCLAYLMVIIMIVGIMPAVHSMDVKAGTRTIRYESEDTSVCTLTKVTTANSRIRTDLSGASGNAAICYYPGNYVTYTVSVEKAGIYDVVMNFAANSNPFGSKITDISMKAVVNEETQVDFTITNNKNYNAFVIYTVPLELAAGTNTIKVENACEDTTIFTNIDYIEITEDEVETTTENPSLYPAAEGRHEAENAISFTKGSADKEASITENEKFSGGKYVGGMNTWPNNGRAYCTTKVNAAVAGTYKMTIGYAGGEKDHPCNIDVRVNSGDWISTQAPVTAWDVVGTITLKVELIEGVNTIDVTGACNVYYADMGWEWINLDYFELEKIENETTSEPPVYTPTPAVGVVEAEDAEFVINGKISSNPAFSGGKYVEAMNGNLNGDMNKVEKYLSYRVNASEEGNYKLHVTYATTSEDTKIGIRTNDDAWQIIHFEPTDSWATVGMRDVVVHLNAGENTIKVTGSVDSGWIILDKFEMERTTEEMTTDPKEIPESDEPEEGQTKKTGVELKQENLVSFRGRNMVNDGSVTFDYTGSGFEFNYNGKGMVKANITTTASETFVVDVDGAISYVRHSSKTGGIVLAEDLPQGNHTIKVYKTKEAMTGLAQLNYMIYDEEAVLTPMDYDYNFLIIGASSTCGNQMDPVTGNEDGYLAFPSVVSRAYNATWQQISVSGRGCTQGTLGEDGWKFSQDNQLRDLYKYQSWFRDKETAFDRTSYVPDVIITNFNNDFGESALKNGYGKEEVFVETLKFIKELRASYPEAKIIMAYGNYPNNYEGTYINYDIIEMYKENIANYIVETGDENIAFVPFPDLVNGQSGHANEEEHKYLSELISGQLSTMLNVDNPLPLSHFEAENGTIHGSSGKAVKITTWASKFSDNGYIEGLNTNLNGAEPAEDGSNVSYASVPVKAWKQGVYSISLAASAVNGTETYMRVNGGQWKKVAIKDTGDWARVAVNTAFDAELVEGDNIIDVMGTTNGGYGCVDRVDIKYIKDIDEPETTIPDVTTSETTAPDATTPEITTPDTTTPEVSTPNVTPTEIVTSQQTTTSQKTTTVNPTTQRKPIVKNTKIKSVKMKKVSAKKVKLTLLKVKGAKKYQIQISKTKNFKKILIKKTVKKVKVTITSKKLARKKKLYIRARVKGLRKWSSPKRIKVKK